MKALRRRIRWLWLAALIGVCSHRVGAQVGTSANTSGINTTHRIRLGPIESELHESKSTIAQTVRGDRLGGAGTANPNLLEEAQYSQRQVFRTLKTGIVRVPKIGGTRGQLNVSAPIQKQFGTPAFTWADRPEDVELKLGRFYLDVLALSGTVLFTDNTFLTEGNTDSEAFLIFTLSSTLYFQISETMQLGITGTVGYLPFENEIGFQDPIGDYTYGVETPFRTYFQYDVPLGPNADLTVVDNFSIEPTSFGGGETFDLLARDVRDLEDVEGRHGFRFKQETQRTQRRFRDSIMYLNDVSASVSAIFPTVTRLTTSYTHSNVWFDKARDGSARSTDSIGIDLTSERENLRFKPRVGYTARHFNNKFGYDQTLILGLEGPMSEYIQVAGDFGLNWQGDSNDKTILWNMVFAHQPREGTAYRLVWNKAATFPASGFSERIGVQVEQVLGPRLNVVAIYERTISEPLTNPNNFFGSKEDKIAGRFTHRMGLRMFTDFGYAWTHSVVRENTRARFDTHEILLNIRVEHTTKTQSLIGYRFLRRESNQVGGSYDENVVFYTLTRKF